MTHAQHVVYVWVTHLPMDWVSLIGASLSLAAVVIALITVRQNSSALRNAQEQTKQLQRAVVRPLLRITRSRKSRLAIHSAAATYSVPEHQRAIPFALCNIGLGRAINIRAESSDPGIIVSFGGDSFRFLVSPKEFIVLVAMVTEPSYDLSHGAFSVTIRYDDVLGNSYRYTFKYRYTEDFMGLEQESDEDI